MIIKINPSTFVRYNAGPSLSLRLRRGNILGKTTFHQIAPVHVSSLNHQLTPLLLSILHRSKRHKEVGSLAAILRQIAVFRLY